MGYKNSSRQSEDNMRLLEMQDPALHAEGAWVSMPQAAPGTCSHPAHLRVPSS